MIKITQKVIEQLNNNNYIENSNHVSNKNNKYKDNKFSNNKMITINCNKCKIVTEVPDRRYKTCLKCKNGKICKWAKNCWLVEKKPKNV